MEYFRILIAIVALGLLQAADAASSASGGLYANLNSVDGKVRVDAAKAVVAQRAEAIRQLMSSVKQKDAYELFDPVTLAIQTLGQLRAAEASDLLADSLLIAPPLVNTEPRRPGESHPAFTSLVQIGSPALPSLVRVIGEADNDKARELATLAVSRILGKELARAFLQLKREETSGNVSIRLDTAINSI